MNLGGMRMRCKKSHFTQIILLLWEMRIGPKKVAKMSLLTPNSHSTQNEFAGWNENEL